MNFDPLKLFPPVTFPVSPGTPMISPLIKWDHAQSWQVPKHTDFQSSGAGGKSGCIFEIDASSESDDHYLVGHMIDGRVLFPATGYLVLAWKTLAKLTGQMYDRMPVGFENVSIHRATLLPKSGMLNNHTCKHHY